MIGHPSKKDSKIIHLFRLNIQHFPPRAERLSISRHVDWLGNRKPQGIPHSPFADRFQEPLLSLLFPPLPGAIRILKTFLHTPVGPDTVDLTLFKPTPPQL